MVQGTQSLAAILELARSKGAQLEETFDAAVLLVVTEDDGQEGVTVVTSPGARPPAKAKKEPLTFVVPIQARFKGGALRLSFGRSSVCDLNIPCSSISKHHGYFDSLGGEAWSVQDAGSSNGTKVNGHPVTKSGTVLTDGCELQLGHVSARFLSAKSFCNVLRQRLGV